MMTIRLLIDGVFFQLNNTGIARVWCSIIPFFAKQGIDVFFLDRGGDIPDIAGLQVIPFPDYQSRHSAADSVLIQRVCDEYKIDVFTSTYYSSPITTPMVLIVYDMIPELFDFDLSQRFWSEKQTAILYAKLFLSISHSTKTDLISFYPEISESLVEVAHCGVDIDVFKLYDTSAQNKFKEKFELNRPFFLFVGSRMQHKGYKNSELFFAALDTMDEADFDVLCVGGEKTIEPELLDKMPKGVNCKRVVLTDEELGIAYNCARGLVYPSLYEGFGMPVIEAMASGCAVITTKHGSLAEAAGNAAHLISGFEVDEMKDAIIKFSDDSYRSQLEDSGLVHSRNFIWEKMASTFIMQVKKIYKLNRKGKFVPFVKEWEKVRRIQADVDY